MDKPTKEEIRKRSERFPVCDGNLIEPLVETVEKVVPAPEPSNDPSKSESRAA